MPKLRNKMLLSGAALLALFIILLFISIDLYLDIVLSDMTDEACLFISTFKIAILVIGVGGLSLHSLTIWILFNRLSRPLQQIINHILSYTEGELLPPIELDSVKKGEVEKIAAILNAMIDKIKKQMDHLKLNWIETVEILESLEEGVLSVDNQGQITFANESACKILGKTRETIVFRSLKEAGIAEQDLAAKCREAIQDALQTNELARYAWNDAKGGKTHLGLIASPRPGQRGAILVLQNKSADFKVLELGKDFIANASHELRTPITIIRGFAETLQEYPKFSPQVLREISGKIVKTSLRLENLVKSLLTLADIENFSAEKFQTTDLVSIAEHCKQFAITAHLKSDISFTSELDQAPILGDPQLLDLAVMNLLENSIKYSPPAAKIGLSIQRAGSQIQLIVEDKGIGIPEADLPYIFDRFYTVDKARSRKSGGTGLGLAIVKTIVEKHLGTVTVSSEIGVGSAFTISLQLAP